MNDKQKQIEEMAKVISPYCDFCKITKCENCNRKKTSKCRYYSFAKRCIMNGYRKQSDTAREILKWLKLLYSERQKEYTNWDGNKISAVTTEWLNADIETIATKYGVEVEE